MTRALEMLRYAEVATISTNGKPWHRVNRKQCGAAKCAAFSVPQVPYGGNFNRSPTMRSFAGPKPMLFNAESLRIDRLYVRTLDVVDWRDILQVRLHGTNMPARKSMRANGLEPSTSSLGSAFGNRANAVSYCEVSSFGDAWFAEIA
jgi:hypothetical protein